MARVDEPQGQPVVSERELDATALVSADRFLALGVAYRQIVDRDGAETLGRVVSAQTMRFRVPGQIAIPTMTALYRLEARINRGLAADDDDAETNRQLAAALEEAHDRIAAIVSERAPDAFADTQVGGIRVRPQIELELNQVLGILAWLSGDVSIADALARALTAGATGALTAPEAAAQAEAEGGQPEDAAPLRSSAR